MALLLSATECGDVDKNLLCMHIKLPTVCVCSWPQERQMF